MQVVGSKRFSAGRGIGTYGSDLGFGVLGSRFRFLFTIPSQSRFQVSGFEIRDSGFRFRDSGFGIQDSGFGIRVSGFGFRVSGFGIRVPGFGVRVHRAGLLADEHEEGLWSISRNPKT